MIVATQQTQALSLLNVKQIPDNKTISEIIAIFFSVFLVQAKKLWVKLFGQVNILTMNHWVSFNYSDAQNYLCLGVLVLNRSGVNRGPRR